jgi:hypothetical protein
MSLPGSSAQKAFRVGLQGDGVVMFRVSCAIEERDMAPTGCF